MSLLAHTRRPESAFRELPPVAPPVDVTDARAFPNIAEAQEYARKLREQSK